MDPLGILTDRILGPLTPALSARLVWARRGRDDVGKAVVVAVVRPAQTVVDIGANVGLYTDRLARVVGREGTVVSFEPYPGYASRIERIARTHGNVRFVAAALSSVSKSASLSVPEGDKGPNAAMASLEARPASGSDVVPVKTTTLDEQLSGVGPISFVKCDVEGHEHDVLLGGRRVLSRDRPVLFLEIEQRHRSRPVHETFTLLEELGYDTFMMTVDGPRPVSEFDVDAHQLDLIAHDPKTPRPPAAYVNDFLCIPAGEQLPV